MGIRFELIRVNNLNTASSNFDEFKLLKSAKKVYKGSNLRVKYDKNNHVIDSCYGEKGSGFGWLIDHTRCDFITCEYDDGFSEILYEDLEIVMSIMRDIKSKHDLITVVNSIAIPNGFHLEVVREDLLYAHQPYF